MTEDELRATVEDARAQLAAMPVWKQQWLEKYMGYNGKPPKNQPMGHLPPPPPLIRQVPQSAAQTGRNVMTAEEQYQFLLRNMAHNRQREEELRSQREEKERAAKKTSIPGTDLSKRPKRKITLE